MTTNDELLREINKLKHRDDDIDWSSFGGGVGASMGLAHQWDLPMKNRMLGGIVGTLAGLSLGEGLNILLKNMSPALYPEI